MAKAKTQRLLDGPLVRSLRFGCLPFLLDELAEVVPACAIAPGEKTAAREPFAVVMI